MTDTQKRPTNVGGSNAAGITTPLSDIFYLTLRHWQWILLSVLICVGGAYFYLLTKPNVYSRSAEVLIKDDKQGKSIGSDLTELGLFKARTNIQNEMINLQAKDLMAEVVKRLGLQYSYYSKGRFHNNVAYGLDLPVTVNIHGLPDEDAASFRLAVDAEGGVTISDLEHRSSDELRRPSSELPERDYTGRLGDSIATPLGNIVVTPSSSFVPNQETKLIVKKQPLSAASSSYIGRLSVSMTDEDGTVVKLTLSDQSTQRADEVLTTLIGVYNENWIRDKNQIAVSTSNFINDRLGVIEGELGNVDANISSYKSANLVPDVSAAAAMYMSQSQKTQSDILDVNNQLSMARYIRSYLTADGAHEQLLPANTGLQNSNIQSLISEYNNRVLQRNSLVEKSSEKNPLVAQIDGQLAAQRQAIVRTIDNEIIALNTQLKSLRGSEAQTMSRIASNPTQAKNLLSVERQQKVKESLYLFLLQKREENELSQAFTAYNTRIVNRPGPSGVPPTPNRRNILAIAFLLGLAIPFGITYLREMNNTKVRGRKDIEHLATPFLGEIPMVEPVKGEEPVDTKTTIVVRSGTRNIINEAFRVLRTNVEFMCNPGTSPCTVAVTSFNPGSGKSFISVNLGMSIALKGKRVIVVDGDMRHGSTSVYVGSPSHGLAEYLRGTSTDLDSLIVVNEACPSLSILPVGAIPPNPTELLESPRFAELVETLRGRYDYILLDCPPIEVVADAQIIDRYAERTFFVLRAGLLERAMLPELDRLYDDKKYVGMAFILNGTLNDPRNSTQTFRYGYGYGYGYDYGNRKGKNK